MKEQGIHHLYEWQGSQALSWCQSAARQRDCHPSQAEAQDEYRRNDEYGNQHEQHRRHDCYDC